MTRQEYIERLNMSEIAEVIEKYRERELSVTEGLELIRQLTERGDNNDIQCTD